MDATTPLPAAPKAPTRQTPTTSPMAELIPIPDNAVSTSKDKGKAKTGEGVGVQITGQKEDMQSRVAGLSLKIQEAVPIGQVIISEQIRDKYKKLKDLLGTGKKQSLIWTDNYLQNSEIVDVDLWFKCSTAERRVLLTAALESLIHQTSVQSAASIMVGAWGLRSCTNFREYLFEKKKPKMMAPPVSVTDLEGRVLCRVDSTYRVSPEAVVPDLEPGKLDHWERSATYICAAVLRLVVKEETNLMNAWKYIMAQYRNFYQEDILIDITPSAQCLKVVRQVFQSRTVVKNTTGIFLLAFTGLVGRDKGICKMLYALQMCYTGMHAYSLLLSCADKLGAPLADFVSLLEHPSTAPALEAISDILLQYEFPQSKADVARLEGAKTWRYARIFDQDVFAHVQAKNCIMLTSILAFISHKLGTKGAGDVTKIRQIAGFAESQREWLEEISQNVVDYCLRAGWVEESMISGTGNRVKPAEGSKSPAEGSKSRKS